MNTHDTKWWNDAAIICLFSWSLFLFSPLFVSEGDPSLSLCIPFSFWRGMCGCR